MKITVRTGGLLGKYLPAGSDNNRAEIEVPDDATPQQVMAQLGVPLDGSYLISLNGSAVPKAQRSEMRLTENDTLAIMPPLRGG